MREEVESWLRNKGRMKGDGRKRAKAGGPGPNQTLQAAPIVVEFPKIIMRSTLRQWENNKDST